MNTRLPLRARVSNRIFKNSIQHDLPEVVRRHIASMQVCVPKDFSNDEVIAFANKANESGTMDGWRIRKDGDLWLNGDPERQQCEKRPGCCHIMLDC